MSISQRRGTITHTERGLKFTTSNKLAADYFTKPGLQNCVESNSQKTRKGAKRSYQSVQTGFIKGSYIGQIIRLINDILEQTVAQNMPGILLQLDFKKAFDTIEWKFVQKTLALFNFGDSFQRWISTLYTNPESSIMNSGFCTNSFKLSRGVRQGCPLSPYLFILSVEILACKIR